MEKLSRVKKYEDLRNQINNGSDEDLNTVDVASFQSRLNNLDSNSFKAPNPTPVRRNETMAQYRKDAFDSFREPIIEKPQESATHVEEYKEVTAIKNQYVQPTSNEAFLDSLDDILNNYINEVNEYNSNRGLITAEEVKDEIVDNARNESKFTQQKETQEKTYSSKQTIEETAETQEETVVETVVVEEYVEVTEEVIETQEEIATETIETEEIVVETVDSEDVKQANEIIEDQLIDEILEEVENFSEVENTVSQEIEQSLEETEEDIAEPEKEEIIEEYILEEILNEVENFDKEESFDNAQAKEVLVEEPTDDIVLDILNEVENFNKEHDYHIEETAEQEELIEKEETIEDLTAVEEIFEAEETVEKEEINTETVESESGEISEVDVISEAEEEAVEVVEVEETVEVEKDATEEVAEAEEVVNQITEDQIQDITSISNEESLEDNFVQEKITSEEDGFEEDNVVDISDFANIFNEKPNPFIEIIESVSKTEEEHQEDFFEIDDNDYIESLDSSLDISFENIDELSIDSIVNEVKSSHETKEDVFEINNQPIDYESYKREESVEEQSEEVDVSIEDIINSYVDPEREVQLEEVVVPNIDTAGVLEQLNNINIEVPTKETSEDKQEIVVDNIDETILIDLVNELDDQSNQLNNYNSDIPTLKDELNKVDEILSQVDDFVEPKVDFIEEPEEELINEVSLNDIGDINFVDEVKEDIIDVVEDIPSENVNEVEEESQEIVQEFDKINEADVVIEETKEEKVEDILEEIQDDRIDGVVEEIQDDKIDDVLEEIQDDHVDDVVEEVVFIEDTQALEAGELLDELANSKSLSDVEKTLILEAKDIINNLNDESNSNLSLGIDDRGVTNDEIEDTQVIPVKEDLSDIDIVSEEIQKTKELQLNGLKDCIEQEELVAQQQQEEDLAQTMFAVKNELTDALKPFADAELEEDEEELEDGEMYYYEEANPNKILNLILIVLIVALVAILGVIAYWILLAKGVI